MSSKGGAPVPSVTMEEECGPIHQEVFYPQADVLWRSAVTEMALSVDLLVQYVYWWGSKAVGRAALKC